MEKERFERATDGMESPPSRPNPFRPVWSDPDMTCDSCRYNDQDIDTFPCARCHTRTQ
ncbi:hypothetical protein EDC39_10154 [Geothermobacter ehrlichii]|uniref:Uncharacterized protein n=1 Tax=Geothermobacter ehrlichii TaxID=213224 RepID=A0A5D3WN12_9BACT|nr:hypothetical protein [Geothermobacter ehrlichii]TYO99894.1 hypothetical protein EDC39_10154 [Geothermobacter ehrlichii]